QNFQESSCSYPSRISSYCGKILSAGCPVPTHLEWHTRTLSDLDISYKAFQLPDLPARPCTARKESWRLAVEKHSRASVRTSHSHRLRPVSRGLPLRAWGPFPPHEPACHAWLASRISPLLILLEQISSSTVFSSILW